MMSIAKIKNPGKGGYIIYKAARGAGEFEQKARKSNCSRFHSTILWSPILIGQLKDSITMKNSFATGTLLFLAFLSLCVIINHELKSFSENWPQSADDQEDFSNGDKNSWRLFVRHKVNHTIEPSSKVRQKKNNDLALNIIPATTGSKCSDLIVEKLDQSILTPDNVEWCRWALSARGGGVIVGVSKGLLSQSEQQQYDRLNCNIVNGAVHSCNALWGDEHVKTWATSPNTQVGCKREGKSKVECFKNVNSQNICMITKAQLDFNSLKSSLQLPLPSNKIEAAPGQGFSPLPGFIQADCDPAHSNLDGTDLPLLNVFSKKLSSTRCDEVIEGTTLLYVHENANNFRSMVQDVMNVWMMLWLDKGRASKSKDITLIAIDRMAHDRSPGGKTGPNPFFEIYQNIFKKVLYTSSFSNKSVCVERLLLQPLPSTGFVWDDWNQDATCSYVGPSSLFQRWNFHARNSYGLLADKKLKTNSKLQILLILRNESATAYRHIKNERELKNRLRGLEGKIREKVKDWVDGVAPSAIEVVVKDLSTMPFKKQVQLVAQSSVLVGAHGSGMAHLVHMPIGTRFCCSVLELFPFRDGDGSGSASGVGTIGGGERPTAHGFGNMARRMGSTYERLDVEEELSGVDGMQVPADKVERFVMNMVANMQSRAASCVVPDVIDDPYLEAWGP